MMVRWVWISMHEGAPKHCGLENNEKLLDLQSEPRYSQSISLRIFFDNTSQSFLVRHDDYYPELPHDHLPRLGDILEGIDRSLGRVPSVSPYDTPQR